MIVKRNFNPLRVWGYIRLPVTVLAVWATGVWAAYHYLEWRFLAQSLAPVTLLGSALAIFLAFRNNTAYARWWEARTAWAGIQTACRVLPAENVMHKLHKVQLAV